MKIERIETTLFRIPLATPVEAASHGVMSEFDMVAVRLTDSGGGTGCGYTVLNAGHGDAVVPIINNVFSKSLLVEDPRCIERLWTRMWRSHHYSGRGGLVSFAIAAVDVALWDLLGKVCKQPVARLLGGYYRRKIRPYASMLFDEPDVFGHSGQQCVVSYADPRRGLAVAYVTNGLQDPLGAPINC